MGDPPTVTPSRLHADSVSPRNSARRRAPGAQARWSSSVWSVESVAEAPVRPASTCPDTPALAADGVDGPGGVFPSYRDLYGGATAG